MLSNENLLNAQNAYINQLQAENAELKTKLRKAADDVLTADALRVTKENELNRTQMIVDGLRKTIRDMQAAAAQRTHDDEVISNLRKHNMALRAECERLRKTPGYTGVPMSVQLDGETFQNNEDGLKAFALAVQRAERKEFKDNLGHYIQQIEDLNNENCSLKSQLCSAEEVLKEKDNELKALRAHIETMQKSTSTANSASPSEKKVEMTSCTPEQYEKICKSIQSVENHINRLVDRIMKY